MHSQYKCTYTNTIVLKWLVSGKYQTQWSNDILELLMDSHMSAWCTTEMGRNDKIWKETNKCTVLWYLHSVIPPNEWQYKIRFCAHTAYTLLI